MAKGSVFTTNKTQAVRLPKSVALPDDVRQVEVITMGRGRLILPADSSWADWFNQPGASADFMTDREQPAPQDRDSL